VELRRLDLRQPGEVLGRERVQAEAGGTGDDLDDALLGQVLDRHLLGRQRADDVEQLATRDDDGAVSLDLRLERATQRELHVRGSETKRALLGTEQDPREHEHRRARRDAARDDAERLGQLVPRADDLERRVQCRFCVDV